MDSSIYNVAINSETAKRKGLKKGDWVELTSAATGKSIEARVHFTEGIHPEVICIAGGGGHWSGGLPVASQPGKGALFEWLIPLNFEGDIDTVSLNIDWCVKVKLSRVMRGRR
jgi:anaerobic selenocysteine-containing dehydrogenase